MATRAASIFRSPAFRMFYAGQTLSYIGDGLRTIAIPLLVYHLTGSASALGITYALEFLPFALIGLVGGSLADRLDRRKLMLACDAARFAIIVYFAIAYATRTLSIGAIYAGIAAIASFAAVFGGGQASSIPYLLGKERTTKAIAALIATEQATTLVTPPLGGALFALTGPLPALLINAASYLASQASLALVGSMGPETPSGLPSVRDVAADIALGFRFLFADRALRALTSLNGAFNFFGLMTGAVLIPYLKRDFGAGDVMVGYALGCTALGALAGSLAAGRAPASWPLGRILMYAYVLDGLLFLPVVFAHDLAVVVLFIAITNALATFEIALIVGWRMRIIPEDLVGRVFGVARLIALFGTVPGAILGGWLADRYGARLPIGVSGFGYLACATFIWLVPSIRAERR